jgi:hypothetical protein
MKHTIWKYPFEVTDNVSISMPGGAQILTVQAQNDTPCVWALVDPEAPKQTHHFRVYGTGHPIDEPGQYLGTFQLYGGSLVFHVFEREL